jgi:DegV family protein with EDD domain
MRKVAIITDETCDMPYHFFKKYDIEVFPFRIVFSDKVFNSVGINGELTLDEYYQKAQKELPTTSIPSIGIIMKILEIAFEKADSVIALLLTDQFSGIFNTVYNISKNGMIKNRDLSVINTEITGSALAALVLESARLAKAGKSKDYILSKINEWLPKVQYAGIMNTLENLVRTGRVKRTKKILCDFLKIKPCIHFENGNIEVIGKIRADDNLLIEQMKHFGEEAIHNMDPDSKTIIIGHNRWAEAAREIAEHMEANNPNGKEIIIQETGAIVANYTGRKLLTIGYLGKFQNNWLTKN